MVVEVPHQSGFLWRGGSGVDVTVRLPEGALADLETVSGSVGADGHLGAVTVRTTSGDISLGPVDGDFVSHSTSGDITVGPVVGDADISTTSGSVRCGAVSRAAQVKTASGDVVVESAGHRLIAETTSGDVTVDQLADGCEMKTTSGDLRIRRLLAGKAELKTISGDVTIGVARGTAVMIDAESLSGSLSSEIELYPDEPSPTVSDQSEGPHAELQRAPLVATFASSGRRRDGRSVPGVRGWSWPCVDLSREWDLAVLDLLYSRHTSATQVTRLAPPQRQLGHQATWPPDLAILSAFWVHFLVLGVFSARFRRKSRPVDARAQKQKRRRESPQRPPSWASATNRPF